MSSSTVVPVPPSPLGLGGTWQATFSLIAKRFGLWLGLTTVSAGSALVIYFVLAQIINLLFRLAERRVNARFEQRTGRGAADLATDSEPVGAS